METDLAAPVVPKHNSRESGRKRDAGGACKEAEKGWREQLRTPGASHSPTEGEQEGGREFQEEGVAGWSNTAKCQV